MAATMEEATEKRTNVYGALGVGFVCLVIGVPLWWKTTDVYRVSLPYAAINTLADTKIQYAVDLKIVSYTDFQEEDLTKLLKLVYEKMEAKHNTVVKSYYRLLVREATLAEKTALQDTSSLKELDAQLTSTTLNKANEYTVLLLPVANKVKLELSTLGVYRNVFVPTFGSDLLNISTEIVQVVKYTLIRERTISKSYNAAKGARNTKPDKEMMRSVRSYSGYDVTLTLVNPQPDILDLHWDIESSINVYLRPLIQKMANLTQIMLQSQILYFTKLQTRPSKIGNEYHCTVKDLPLMINPLEAKLGSPASTNPELNFIVYVPGKNQYPLFIIDDNGVKVTSNSFLSPQWGGILIYNVAPPLENITVPQKVTLQMNTVMEVFLTQLRMLLNLQSQAKGVEYVSPVGQTVVTEWEIDSWLRSRCVENIATASQTLKSLAELLGKIRNIVINDDIGEEVHQAVESLQSSLELLRDGKLEEAYQQSRNAIQASEKAFFDPSLLELLYFPEDQKFAIYIPLFLPISFPVLASLWQAYKWCKGQTKSKLE